MKVLSLVYDCPKRLSKAFAIALMLTLSLLCELSAQDRIIILDQDLEPLIGVTAQSTFSNYTGTSDAHGHLDLPTGQDTISLRYLGYHTKLIATNDLQDNLLDTILMQPDNIIIDQVTVYGRIDQKESELPYRLERIKAKAIQQTNPQTSADALEQHSNVYVQRSQMGGGSPIIRGFEANKVLLVVDGVRLNNAIYRNGHLQNAITIDPAMLDQMEVVFGPNAIIYGSDALGGVIHFKSKRPKLNFESSRPALDGSYYLRHSTANNERTAHLDFNLGGRSWASSTSLTTSSFGDLRMGRQRTELFPDFGLRSQYVERIQGEDQIIDNPNPNVQIGTAYNQLDLMQKVLYQPSTEWSVLANLQYSTSSDIPRYDQLIQRRGDAFQFAEWSYGPQNRLLSSVTVQHSGQTRLYDRAKIIYAYQRIGEDRITRPFGSDIRSTQQERVGIHSITADLHKEISDIQHLDFGIDLHANSVSSTAFANDIITVATADDDILTRYPSSGSSMSTYGAYLRYHINDLSERTHANAGVRYSRTDVGFSYDRSDPIQWPSSFYEGISGQSDALTWSIGLTHHTPSHWRIRAMTSTAFRAPNIDDIAKIRIKADEITFPNASLNPERSLNAELSIGKEFYMDDDPKLDVGATIFWTELQDAIVRRPATTFDGASFFISNGDSLRVVSNQNTRTATIRGISAYANANLTTTLALATSLTLTHGYFTNEDRERLPLDHIPPVYGRISLDYTPSPSWQAQLRWIFNGAKDISDYGGSADNPELATADGALAWNTTNAYLHYSFAKKYHISLALENIFDLHYRAFASGVSGPGRNFIFSFRGTF